MTPQKIHAFKQRLATVRQITRTAVAGPDTDEFPFQRTLDAITGVLEYLRTIPDDPTYADQLRGMIAACEIQLGRLNKISKQWFRLADDAGFARKAVWEYGIETLLPQIQDREIQRELSRRLNKV